MPVLPLATNNKYHFDWMDEKSCIAKKRTRASRN